MHITIIGFGNQAKAWSSNLKDSGLPINVALRPQSSSIEAATRLGFDVIHIGSEEFFNQKYYVLLTPDQAHHDFMQQHGKNFKDGTTIFYAHGYSLLKNQFELKFPMINHVLFAPKAIGSELRKQYLLKGKLGAVYSLEHVTKNKRELEEKVFELAVGLGINLGPYGTSFERETHADLFSEQGLLCSLIPYTAAQMFKNLTDKGIEPELAYFECWHELKLIVNAMVDKGPQGFFDLISPNALIGSEKGFNKLMTPDFNDNLAKLLTEIKSGQFDEEVDQVNVEKLREKIKQRWENTLLMKTFHQINREAK